MTALKVWQAYGQDVKKLRENRGWNQGKLGFLAGEISASGIRIVEDADYTGGGARGPSWDTRKGIQQAFGREPGEDGYELTKKHYGKAQADAFSNDGSKDRLARIVEQVPPERRDDIADLISEAISD